MYRSWTEKNPRSGVAPAGKTHRIGIVLGSSNTTYDDGLSASSSPNLGGHIVSIEHPRLYVRDAEDDPTVTAMPQQDEETNSPGADYDLSRAILPAWGLRQGLTSYGDAHFSLFLRKAFIKALGYSDDALSRPIVGIINTYSSFNPCHANVPQLIEAAKRGVQLNGGLAIDFPTISLHESFAHPTSMFLRNLMSMDTEEMIRAQPLDACIMIGGA